MMFKGRRCLGGLTAALLVAPALLAGACDQPVAKDHVPEGEIHEIALRATPSAGLVGGLVGGLIGGSGCTADTDCPAVDVSGCIVGACDKASGNCTTKPAPDGTACDDGSACTQ